MKYRVITKTLLAIVFMINYNITHTQPPGPDIFLENLMKANPSHFDTLLSQKDKLNIQVIYTMIDRKKKGKPVFTDFHFNTDTSNYFYPASTVKLPVAILALQKLNELGIAGLDKYTTMITEAAGEKQTAVLNDPSSKDGRPTIAHYIKKILLVSDNDAFNRLYEFLGQEYINSNLHRMGYADIEIIHRLAISLTESQNRLTNPVKFLDSSGKLIYEKPAEQSGWKYAQRNTRVGKGFMRGDILINEPFDFSQKNRMSLHSLHGIMKSILFPAAIPEIQRFKLTNDDYEFLYRYMSMRPGESVSPAYDSTEFWDNYCKMILLGVEKKEPLPGIRIFSKSGWSYGFLTDAAYIADFDNNIEFLVTATIYCNRDGILNDDKYDYRTVGYPFLKHLGEAIYQHELKRKRRHKPDLAAFRFTYDEK